MEVIVHEKKVNKKKRKDMGKWGERGNRNVVYKEKGNKKKG